MLTDIPSSQLRKLRLRDSKRTASVSLPTFVLYFLVSMFPCTELSKKLIFPHWGYETRSCQPSILAQLYHNHFAIVGTLAKLLILNCFTY